MDTIEGTAGLRARVDEELGVSGWYEITQGRIDAFAAATDDHEEIHVNPERAAGTPFGVTIATACSPSRSARSSCMRCSR